MKQRAIRIPEIQDKDYTFHQVINKLTYKKSANEKIKVISLFSGCGGLDLGFEGGFDVPKACVKNLDFIDSGKRRENYFKEKPF